MIKQELLQIVEPLDLTEASMNKIDVLLSSYSDSSPVEVGHIKAIIEMIGLEEALDEEVLNTLNSLIVSTEEYARDVDTIIETANTEIDLKEEEVTRKLDKAQKELSEIESRASVSQNTQQATQPPIQPTEQYVPPIPQQPVQ